MNERLEMFSDGVFAIAITVLILEIKVPPVETIQTVADVWHAIGKLWPSFFALTLSFIIILISWVGHANLLKRLDKTSPQFQFANGFFLFTVIFIPFPTAFMAEYFNTPFAQPAIVFYCLMTLLHSVGWNVLLRYIRVPEPLYKTSEDKILLANVSKGSKYGFFVNVITTVLAWWFPFVAIILSSLLWIYWLYLSASVKHPDMDTAPHN